MERKFSTKILDTLLNTVEVDFKIPLGVAEIKFPISDHAKRWWSNEKAKEELLSAIQIAEDKFVKENPENKAAQILHDISLKDDGDFQEIISGLLNHLDEEKITWLTALKLGHGFEQIVSREELQSALADYLPYLRHELIRLEAFREIISALTIQRIDKRTEQIDSKVNKILQSSQQNIKPEYEPETLTELSELPPISDYLPPGSRMPFYRNKVFTGRERDLIELGRSLISTSNSPQRTIITQTTATTGMGGIGKTQLAVEFCYRYGRYYHGVHWINANESNFEAEIAACGKEMELSYFPETTPEQVNITLREWKNNPLRLVVLDNLEDPDLLKKWLPKLNVLGILITTRRQQWSADLGVYIHKVYTLSRPDSLILLRKLAPRLDTTPNTDLNLLADRLGDLPLALDLAGRYLNARPLLGIHDYLSLLDKAGNTLVHTSLSGWAQKDNPTAHETSLVETFLLSWNQLEDTEVDELAKLFFFSTGFLAPNIPIPSSLSESNIGQRN
jgi:hypothetical protein